MGEEKRETLIGYFLGIESAAWICTLTRNRTSNFLVHRTALNQLSHTGQGGLQCLDFLGGLSSQMFTGTSSILWFYSQGENSSGFLLFPEPRSQELGSNLSPVAEAGIRQHQQEGRRVEAGRRTESYRGYIFLQ